MYICTFLKSLSSFTTFQEAAEGYTDQNEGVNQEVTRFKLPGVLT